MCDDIYNSNTVNNQLDAQWIDHSRSYVVVVRKTIRVRVRQQQPHRIFFFSYSSLGVRALKENSEPQSLH